MKRLNLLFLLGFLSACDGTEAAGGDAGAGACVQSDLIAQCPIGANPLIGAQAEASCEAAVGGVVQDAEGQATGQCYGVGSCRVVCQFAVPCRCGVASVSREGVVCASCDGAASCGNNVCEGGESPQNCPIDCGAVCTAGERRCDGERLQECNLQGRFDTLPCPQGEVCDFVDGSPRCVRDPGIIEGQDGGVGDGGVGPDDGRIIPGDGTWPVIAPVAGPPFPRELNTRAVVVALDGGGVNNPPTPFARAMDAAGARNLWRWRLMPDGERVEGLGGNGTVRVGLDGVLEYYRPEYPPTDLSAFCQVYTTCFPGQEASCPGSWDAWGEGPHGAWRQACMSAVGAMNCEVFFGEGPCWATPLQPYPEAVRIDANDHHLAGARLLGVALDRTHLTALDLDVGTVYQHTPVGAFTLTNDTHVTALSADGRVAATVGYQGVDKVIIVWDVQAGERRALLPRSVGDIAHLALSPDGQVLAMVLFNSAQPEVEGVISLWNLAEEKRILSIRPPPGDSTPGLQLLAFTPDGAHLVFDIQGQAAAEVWSLGAAPEPRQVLPLDGERISHAALAPDGFTLALGSHLTHRVSLWDLRDGQRWRTLEAVQGELREVRFAADGRSLLVLHQDSQVAYSFRIFEP